MTPESPLAPLWMSEARSVCGSDVRRPVGFGRAGRSSRQSGVVTVGLAENIGVRC